MRKHQSKRLTALLLALVLCLGLAVPAGAADTTSSGVKIEKVDNSAVSVSLTDDSQQTTITEEETPLYQDTDMVRVSIVLKGKSTLEKGFSTQHIAANSQAMAYRSGLQAQQETLAKKISKDALGGKTLDVVWNLTLAANIISANVAYGDIDAIKAVSGVEDVVLETRYEPQVASVDALDPNMATSGSMIGSGVAYEAGYNGAGTRIAVIDTGTDTDHQSFNEDAFLHAIAEDGKTDSLMTKADITNVLSELNIAGNDGVTADSLYLTAKLPFAYNYVDGDFDVTHDHDSQSEHGSHVAGIATANRYIKNSDGTYSDALDVAHMKGVAPDAQLITMKVFGKGGGAYEADYMAAIEDAILLDCDSVNLSLGSAMVGMATNSTYQDILDSLVESDTVVSVSSGNASYWGENAESGSYLYAEDVNFQTDSAPGSYTNSLTVASADNIGSTGTPLLFGENKVFYTESSYTNAVITTLDKSTDGSGTEYDFIYTTGTGSAAELKTLQDAGVDFTGKVVLVSRGTISFSDKHLAAAGVDAAACIVVNNAVGEINMDLSGSKATIPCVAISQADGKTVQTLANAVKDAGGNILYYTGKVTISSKISSGFSDSKNYSMSYFSSWGVPGSLQLKPEITAPGGNIYSVNGADKSGTAYENMSGTSMAAPQVAGMAALVAQYLNERDIKADGLTTRALIQSLLMSTAVPLKTEKGTYYPVIQQGAGLANVGNAINAHSYITMDADATSGASDGKVKVELGDDPAKTGVYTFGFTLHDLSGKGGTYALSGDVFTQALFTEGGIDYLDTATTALAGAKVSFDQDSVTLTANGKADVSVTIDVTGCNALKNYPNGTYIQAFITAAEESTEEGVTGTTHSIPVLGFYGSWTDASMYDVGTYMERKMGMETRDSYLDVERTNIFVYAYPDEIYQRGFGENRYDEDEEYLEDRNSLNSTTGEKILGVGYSAIRNAGGSVIQVVDAETGEVYVRHETGEKLAALYYTEQDEWMYSSAIQWFYWPGTDQKGNSLSDGTKVKYELILAPEYYASADGNYDWDALTDGNPDNDELGKGAYLGTTLTIDNTAPEVLSAEVEGSILTVTAKDERYLACMALTNGAGTKVLNKVLPNQKTANTEYICDFDLSGFYGKEFLVVACDYAGNEAVYRVTLKEAFNGADTNGAILGATSGKEWYAMKDGSVTKFDDADNQYFGAAYVGGVVYLSNSNGLYVTDMDHLTTPTLLASYPGVIVTNLAYDYNAETLYGVALDAITEEAQLVKLDLGSGVMTAIGDLTVETNMLATDSKGNFYSIENGSGDLYTFTLDTLDAPTLVGSTGYLNNSVQGLTYNNNDGQLYWAQYYTTRSAVKCDINGDGKTNADDAQLILDYASGKMTEEEIAEKDYNFKKADINKDGRIDTFDAHLLLNLNSRNAEMAYLLRVDTEDASTQIAATLPAETAALFAPDDTTLPVALTSSTPVSVSISQDTLSLAPSVSARLTAFAAPWNLADTSVTWSSSDEDVATVDETGLVTAKSVGTATITAAVSADPSVTATCTVTVTAVDVTITGALQDADRNAQLFTWNLGEDNTWTPGAALENSVESVVATPDGSIWQMDAYDYYMHQVNTAGETLGSYQGTGTPMADIGYSAYFTEHEGKTQIYGAYQWGIYLQQDPTALTSVYADMLVYLMFYAGAGEYVAITSGIPTSITNDEGETYPGESIYLLDNVGNVWMVGFYMDETGSINAVYKFTPCTDLYYLTYPGEGANKNCSLVVADNGDLFFSYYNGSNNVLYRLTLNEDESMYNATLIADFGEGVRPASLLSAAYNDTETADASANVISTADALFSGTVAELNAQSEVFAAQLDSTLTRFNADAGTSASTSAGTLSVTPGQGDSKTVTLDLNAENSTNGKLTIGYDTDVLTLTAVEPTDAALNSFVTAEDGTVTFAYANKTAVNGKLATLTFSYDASTAPKTTVATVTTLEEGGSQKEIAQNVTLTLKDEVVVPVGPSEPSKPSTPTEPTTPEFPFKDIGKDHPFYEDIKYVYEKGLMQGVSEDIFQSATTTTRGMIATILYRMEGEPAVKNASSFRDVADGMYYTKAVAWAAANGIVNGYADGTFQPDQTISREQMAAILYRYAQYKGCDVSVGEDTNILSYTDAAQVASYAVPAFQWAVGAGIINGTTATTLSPKGSATRGQVAAILHRYCEWIG